MTRIFVLAIAALAILAGSASARDPRIAANGPHLDGLRTGVSAGAVDAIVLPTGATVTVR